MGTGGSFLGVKRAVREADHLPPSSAEFKNVGAIPPLPIYLHGIVLNLVSRGTTLPIFLHSSHRCYRVHNLLEIVLLM
jgi:hypothetical protein